ncbi:hypothetical protein AXG93_2381s1010 [Marchantia polymorpha subsp. ruderalis]|uniref:Uncharacterized protein n=1 Tax=Marchantia polymorpha subsp. ruderalis TaxID=1480154 RepID=A0A176VR11_MARPO|nr:hypothetical protein AXG93_2381s1010 [Marchantia polymorpha subsp. ruderalis]
MVSLPLSMGEVSANLSLMWTSRICYLAVIQQRIVPKQMGSFKSRFSNDNFMQFSILAMENVCIDLTGALELFETSTEEIMPNISGLSANPELYYLWNEIYNCTGNISTIHGVMALKLQEKAVR